MTIEGQLEIDEKRGVIYFHSYEGFTVLRICQLPKPIPVEQAIKDLTLLDITLGTGCSWKTSSKGIKNEMQPQSL